MPGTTTKVGLDPVDPVKVAVVQAEPSWFDVDEAVERTCEMISEAGKNGARLIAFPELWIPGYPTFIFAHDQKGIAKYHVPYFRNALEVESSHMARIRCSARSAKIMVVIGYAERAGGSLYMSQTFIGDDGSVLLHRRKFKPTHMERFIFGDGSGETARNVVQTDFGRVGGLQCFEHLQPLLKYNEYYQRVQIHVASWPALFPVIGDMPHFNAVDSCSMATQMLAVEGGAFALLASHTQSAKGLKANGLGKEVSPNDIDAPHTAVIGGGFSAIFGPDGRRLTEPTDPKWEGMLYAELDFNQIYIAKQWVDPVGHYSRPDIFSLKVNNVTQRHVIRDEMETTFELVSRFPQLDLDSDVLSTSE